ncbi:Nicotinamide-nucleotide adenylyltransferase, NadM family / ADP-ribose pyrophosphatase [hydrothermal vent metagenome]|uniref:Nicotinamide-nucleotide adenylyltransferase, NadM family / ADP-ribose pyrophosphatase n=1 Tax=hydrothermal vent metagenome TaxID=652676 RepID=A0A3B0YET7_9ZZZZ
MLQEKQAIQKKQKFDYAVYIGRFQPFHLGHMHCVTEALQNAEKLIIVIGSTNQARSFRNPWSFEERQQMMVESLSRSQLSRIIFVGIEDSFYEPGQWRTEVRRLVADSITSDRHGKRKSNASVLITGHFRDNTSQYLRQFMEWKYISVNDYQSIHATTIRNSWFDAFREGGQGKESVSMTSAREISDRKKRQQQWIESNQSTLSANGLQWLINFSTLEQATKIIEEAQYIKEYRAHVSQLRWPVVLVTTDAVLIQNRQVLMVKRRGFPGKGLWALPGGFVDQDERIEDALFRELKEETGVNLSSHELNQCQLATHVFDDPDRSSRGRTITHASVYQLPDMFDHKLQAGDDASEVCWFDLNSLIEIRDQIFEDHYQIVRYFESRYLRDTNSEQNVTIIKFYNNNKQGGFCYD